MNIHSFRKTGILLLIGIFSLFWSCSHGGGGNNPPASETKPVVTLPDGYSGSVEVNKSDIELPEKVENYFVPITSAYDITLDGSGADFGEDLAKIQFEYTDETISDKGLIEELNAFYYDVDSATWKHVESVIYDTESNTATVYTNHFTVFVLTAIPEDATTSVPEAPAEIATTFPSGIGGSCGTVFSLVDESFHYYQDRAYTIQPVNDDPFLADNKAAFEAFGFKGALGISSLNDNKNYAGDDCIVFDAHIDLDVYIMYDTRGGADIYDTSEDAPWIASTGFVNTGYFVQTTDAVNRYTVYKKTYAQGETVSLDGNRKGVTDAGIATNYWAIIKPAGNTDPYAAAETASASPDITPPAAVTSLAATPGSGYIDLSWVNPADTDFTGVVVRKSTTAAPQDPAAGSEPVGTSIGETGFQDTDVVDGTTYYYSVFSMDGNFNWSKSSIAILYSDSGPVILTDAEAVALDAGLTEVGYAYGDYALSVTQNLTLATSGANGSTISWASTSAGNVSGSGVVVQPLGADLVVTLMATISKGTESTTKDFVLTVKQALTFITLWKTDNTGNIVSATDQIKLPLDASGTYNFTVYWGDGTSSVITAYDQAEVTHTYPTAGTYEVTIVGTIEGFGFDYYFSLKGDNSKLLEVRDWGVVKLHNKGYQFNKCDNLIYLAPDPNLSNITNMSNFFRSVSSFNGDLSSWDVSNVTSMNSMFRSASSFNGDLSSWDVSHVTIMSNMFAGASSFNGDLSNWDVSNVIDMSGMFGSASSFNGDLSNWDVSNVTDMSSMFLYSDFFAGDLSSWDVSDVTNMKSMFSGASSFNADLSNWDVSNVTIMGKMFASASSFNADIGGWDVSSVGDMLAMFSGASLFNQDLTGWCVTNITSLPSSFSKDSALQKSYLPLWGTCP